MTVAPPRWKRSAIALPAPFVPPVTRTRLPLNSSGSNGMLDVAIFLNDSLRLDLTADEGPNLLSLIHELYDHCLWRTRHGSELMGFIDECHELRNYLTCRFF